MPKFPQSPFSTLSFHKSPVFTPLVPFAHSFPKKPKVYPKDLVSTSSHFGTIYFLYEPCFHPIFTEVSFSLHSFSREAPFSSQNAQFCSKFLRHNDCPQKPCFYISSCCCIHFACLHSKPLRFCSYFPLGTNV